MRDYGNMPVLDWSEAKAPQKAKAQILHQEPVILQMPDDFNTDLDAEKFGCKRQGNDGMLYDCDGGKVLDHLAGKNALAGLDIVANACAKSSSQVDIDSARSRIIVHD